MEQRKSLPLRLIDTGGAPSLTLGGVEIADFVAADGLKVEYVDLGSRSVPQVTITFAPIGLDLALDIDLLERLLDAAKKAAS